LVQQLPLAEAGAVQLIVHVHMSVSLTWMSTFATVWPSMPLWDPVLMCGPMSRPQDVVVYWFCAHVPAEAVLREPVLFLANNKHLCISAEWRASVHNSLAPLVSTSF
jgi:hypothetical protein